MAQLGKQKGRRGAEMGNRRAWKHGRRSAAAQLRRRETQATLKLVRHLLAAAGMSSRCRPRPVRPDQVALLATVDPGGLRAASALGVVLPV